MTRGFMPEAIEKNIPPGSNDPAIIPCGVIFHVAVSNADSLHDFFNGPSGGIESHFYVRKDGTIEQYRSIFFEADANYRGNSFARDGKTRGFVSVETQGMAEGEWTEEQLASLKAIVRFVHAQSPFMLRPCPGPFADGVGYHTMFGAPSDWTPVSKSCPGPDRIDQFIDTIVPWLAAGAKEDDMPTPEDLWNAKLPEFDKGTEQEERPARVLLAQAHARAGDARAAANRCERAVKALAKALGPEVEKAVEAALAEAVIDVDVNVAQGAEG